MGLSLSGGYAEQNVTVGVMDEAVRQNGRGIDWALKQAEKKVLEDGFGVDKEEIVGVVAGNEKRQHFLEKDPGLFSLIEELGIEPQKGKTPVQLVTELMPFCGPEFDYFPRIDHFVMRILSEQNEAEKLKFSQKMDKWRNTLLHLASKRLSSEIVTFLVEHYPEIDCNELNKRKRNALHETMMTASRTEEWVSHHSFLVAEALLRAGADPSKQDRDLVSPLHLAAAAGDTTVVGLMLLYGAEPNSEDKFGRKPVAVAMENNHIKCASLLHTDTQWSEFQDKRTGRLFYINALTKEETMERPLSVKADFSTVVYQLQQQQQQQDQCVDDEQRNRNDEQEQDPQEQEHELRVEEDVKEALLPREDIVSKSSGNDTTEIPRVLNSTQGDQSCDKNGLVSRKSSIRSSIASFHSASSASARSLLSMGSSLLSMKGVPIQERMRKWKELAWREGIRKAAKQKQMRSLSVLRTYKDAVNKDQRIGRQQLEGLKQELEDIIQSRDLTTDQLEKLKNSLAKEQAEKSALLSKLQTAQQELEMAQEIISVTQKEKESAQQTAEYHRKLTSKMETMEETLRAQAEENARLRQDFMAEQVLRRKTHNKNMDLLGAIRVYCRIRPLSGVELSKHPRAAVTPGQGMDLDSAVIPSKDKSFRFDACLGPDSSQLDVFAQVEPLIQSTVDGYNVCIFAYGQTGSGKSFTMFGPKDGKEELRGIAPRAIFSLYDLLKNRDTQSYSVCCSAVELYNSQLRDLLVEKSISQKLSVKKDPSGTVYVENAVIQKLDSAEEMLSMLFELQNRRIVAATKMNSESSRSHLVFSILVELTERQTNTVIKGKLSLVDLAGSEKVAQSGVSGQGLKEAVAINQSLSALGDVISALTEQKKFIPYRNHILTQLMADVLGGNAKTLMFVNVSPVESSVTESINSLQYATRVKKIKNNARKNVETEEIQNLKREIAYLRQRTRQCDISDDDFALRESEAGDGEDE